jgi:hypothetical protein
VATIACDVRRREDVKRLILATLVGVLQRLDAALPGRVEAGP